LLRRSLILVAALIAVLVPASAQARTAAFPVTVHAANGDVVVRAKPTRIVSISPSATETLYAVGAGPQVVAVDDFSTYPKQAPRTSISSFSPNAEAIAAYNPDLVIVSTDRGIVAALQKLGITVIHEPAANTVAEAYDQMRQIGQATGHDTAASKLVRSLQKKLTALIRSVPKKQRHLKVYHELTTDYYSAASSTFIGRVYKLFGFTNIADAADTAHTGYPQLSAEYIVSSNPDLVVLADSVCCKQNAASVAARPGWGGIAAVKKKRIVAVNDDIASRWGPRILDFARAVAAVARRS
jgi:iron complex transport system substrate-binding protein